MSKWIPDRKFLAGGVSGVVAFFASQFAGLPAELATSVAGALWALAMYFVPASVEDTVKRVDQTIADLARERGQAK